MNDCAQHVIKFSKKFGANKTLAEIAALPGGVLYLRDLWVWEYCSSETKAALDVFLARPEIDALYRLQHNERCRRRDRPAFTTHAARERAVEYGY